MSSDIVSLTEGLIRFRDARDWKQFHTLKNLASALSVEASELLELTLWKTDEQLGNAAQDRELLSAFSSEIADVLIFLLLICERLGIDPMLAAQEKVARNEERYPIERSRGSAKKYSDF